MSEGLAEPVTQAKELSADQLRVKFERERKARLQAEAISEKAQREVYDRHRDLELLEAIAAASNSAHEIRPALQVTVDAICNHTGWPIGHAFLLSRDNETMVPSGVWHLEDPVLYQPFRRLTETKVFVKGEGLVGRTFAAEAPIWIPDAKKDDNFPRAHATEGTSINAAFAFPIFTGESIAGVVEFFSPVVNEPDQKLLDVVSQAGYQLGRVIERQRNARESARRSEELERYANELEYANDELKEFAYVASHDLSEPLRTISGFVQLLQKRYAGQLDETADEFMGFVVDGTERMQSLIDGLLSYSRAGRSELVRTRVDLNEVADRAVQSLGASIEDSAVKLDIGDLPVVGGDAGQLDRLFENLLSNAIKFRAPERPPEVTVTAELRSGGWHIVVADNGIGIEERHRERIFNVFQRLHSTADYPGTGIGLSICKKVVERHGGRIWVEETAGGGSTFEIVLPELTEEEEAE